MERFHTEEGGRLCVINTLGIVHKVWILYYYVRVFDQHQMGFFPHHCGNVFTLMNLCEINALAVSDCDIQMFLHLLCL